MIGFPSGRIGGLPDSGKAVQSPRIVRAIRELPEVAAAIELIERTERPSSHELTRGRCDLRALMVRASHEATGITLGQWTKYKPALLSLMRHMGRRRQHAMVAEGTRPRRTPGHWRGPDAPGPGIPVREAA